MKHVHAELMAQYAQDAMTTDKPWELWELSSDGKPGNWFPMYEYPAWITVMKYRRKPKTIRVGNRDLPEPLRVAPADGENFWTVCVEQETPLEDAWHGYRSQERYLRRGLCHSTKEAAEQWRDAFIELAGGEV